MTGLQKEQTQPARAGSHVHANEADAVERSSPMVDMEQARRYLQVLDPSTSDFHFRTFPDHGDGPGRNYHGTLDDLAIDLQLDNGNGRGVFVVVNAGGQKANEIERVRAVFADFDTDDALRRLDEDAGALRIAGKAPQLMVRSSPGKLHVYWTVDDLSPDEFGEVQKSLADRFRSDPTVHDLSRVMRLPGFFHHKNGRVRTELLYPHDGENVGVPFKAAEIRAALPGRKGGVIGKLTAANFAPVPHVQIAGEQARVVEAGRHEDVVVLAAQLARKIVFEGLGRPAALALIHAERERGRWTRLVSDAEIGAALESAIAKCRAGDWTPVASAVGSELQHAQATAFSARDRSLNFRSAGELMNDPMPVKWLIRHTLEEDSLCQVFGDPGSGKSFLAIDWAASIATGREWNGRKVAQGAVFYIAGEGLAGIKRRLKAWKIAHGLPVDQAPLFISGRPASLTNDEAGLRAAMEDVGRLMREHGAPKLIVLDTVARNFGQGDENKTQDMTAFVAACDLLRTETGATVLAVHHSGHGDKSRGRGSAALKAALDWEYAVVKEAGAVNLINSKAKECELQPQSAFRLETVDLGTVDDEGEPVVSAVLYPTTALPPVKNGKLGSGKNQTRALRVLHEGINEYASRTDRDGDPWMARAIWRERCEADGLERKQFTEAVKRLSDQNIICIDGERVTFSTTYRSRPVA